MFDPRILFPDGITSDLVRRLEGNARSQGLDEEDVTTAMVELQDSDSVKRQKERDKKQAVVDAQELLKQVMVVEARRSGVSEDKIRKIAPELAFPGLSKEEKQRLQAVEERLQAIKPEIVDFCEGIVKLASETNVLVNEGLGIVNGKDHPGFSQKEAVRYILGAMLYLSRSLPNVFSINAPAETSYLWSEAKIGREGRLTVTLQRNQDGTYVSIDTETGEIMR